MEALSFSEALKESTSKIFQFTGRARRSEYWWTMLVVWIAQVVLSFCGILSVLSLLLGLAVIPLTFRRLHDTGKSGWWWGVGAIMKLIFVVTIVSKAVMLAVGGYSDGDFEDMSETDAWALVGEYLIYTVIICLYQLVMLVFCCLDSSREENKYGVSPKYADERD